MITLWFAFGLHEREEHLDGGGDYLGFFLALFASLVTIWIANWTV